MILVKVYRAALFGKNLLQQLGFSTIFLLKIVASCANSRFLVLFIKQLYSIGVLSLPIILLAGMFVGMVLGLQGYTILSQYSAESTIGQLVGLSLTRELAPVISALLFAGRAGSALTAEIGLMKTTEQLNSLEMMGIDPVKRIVGPRFWGGLVALPWLNLMFIMVALYGGRLVVVNWLNLDYADYWASMRQAVSFSHDVLNGIIKSVIFAFTVAWIATYMGYTAKPTAAGVNIATTKTVVYSSIAILAMDFLLTALMFS